MNADSRGESGSKRSLIIDEAFLCGRPATGAASHVSARVARTRGGVAPSTFDHGHCAASSSSSRSTLARLMRLARSFGWLPRRQPERERFEQRRRTCARCILSISAPRQPSGPVSTPYSSTAVPLHSARPSPRWVGSVETPESLASSLPSWVSFSPYLVRPSVKSSCARLMDLTFVGCPLRETTTERR